MLLVHHTDAQREYAYDRESHIGKLNKALDAAQQDGWTVVDMQNDWKVPRVSTTSSQRMFWIVSDALATALSIAS
jgi:hypothetical protein